MHLAETSTTLRDVSSFGDCQQIPEKMMGVVKHFFFCLYKQLDPTDVSHFRYEMPEETFHLILAIRYPATGEGVGDLAESAPSLQILFQNAHGTCNKFTNV